MAKHRNIRFDLRNAYPCRRHYRLSWHDQDRAMGRIAGGSTMGIYQPNNLSVPLRHDILVPYKMHDYRAGRSAEKLRGARDREDVSRFGECYHCSSTTRQESGVRREAI